MSDLITELPGATGYRGAQGSQGFTGTQGARGVQGIQGSQGPIGYTGLFGLQGDSGLQGIQGLAGPYTGVQGVKGVQGNQGEVGVPGGPQGLQGNQGFQGLPGEKGVIGPQGARGIQGATGPQGFRGIQGLQGIQGEQGFRGVQGFTGSDGTSGFQGVQGNVGNQEGATGPRGVQGDIGATGATGPQGFQGGGNVGTPGATGVTGLQGFQGGVGNTGVTGIIGVGPQGLQGSVGTTGVTGATGVQGFQGNAGFQGSQGDRGVQGSQGSVGIGGIGASGVIGTQGATGVDGPQGVQGATGLRGSQGVGISATLTGLIQNNNNWTAGLPYKFEFGNTYTAYQNNPLVYSGLARQTTAQFRYGTASAFFASGSPLNYLRIGPFNSSISYSGFTYECWVRLTVTNVAQTVFSVMNSSNLNFIHLQIRNTGVPSVFLSYAGTTSTWNVSDAVTTATALTANTWNYMALTFDGTATYQLFLNNARLWTITNGSAIPASALNNLVCLGGFLNAGTVTQALSGGFIDEFRISNISRWTNTATITAPTSVFTHDANTVFLHHFNDTTSTSTGGSPNWSVGQETPGVVAYTLQPMIDQSNQILTNNLNANQLTLSRLREPIVNLGTIALATINISYLSGSVFYVTPNSNSNITLNITNVPQKYNTMFYMTLFIDTSSFKPTVTTLTVNGSSVSMTYAGDSALINISTSTVVSQTFTMIYLYNIWQVVTNTTSFM